MSTQKAADPAKLPVFKWILAVSRLKKGVPGLGYAGSPHFHKRHLGALTAEPRQARSQHAAT